MEIWKKMWVGVFFLNTVYVNVVDKRSAHDYLVFSGLYCWQLNCCAACDWCWDCRSMWTVFCTVWSLWCKQLTSKRNELMSMYRSVKWKIGLLARVMSCSTNGKKCLASLSPTLWSCLAAMVASIAGCVRADVRSGEPYLLRRWKARETLHY